MTLDLDLREEPSDVVASEATEQAAAHVASDRTFLKIDSTLRGPVAGLIRGALRGARKPVAVIAPAFPEQGRMYSHGRVVVHGVPGPSLLDIVGLERTALLTSTADLEPAIEHARMRGAVNIIVDVDGPSAMVSLAAASLRHPEWLLVGSAGLTRRLAPAVLPPVLTLGGGGPVLVVAGSPAEVTHHQIDRLPRSDDILVLCTTPTSERDEGQASNALAEDVLKLSLTLRPRAVVLAGGATARAVCHRLKVHSVRLIGELSPGIPVGYLEGGVWDAVALISKAGGFGTPDTLLDVVRALGVSIQSTNHDRL